MLHLNSELLPSKISLWITNLCRTLQCWSWTFWVQNNLSLLNIEMWGQKVPIFKLCVLIENTVYTDEASYSQEKYNFVACLVWSTQTFTVCVIHKMMLQAHLEKCLFGRHNLIKMPYLICNQRQAHYVRIPLAGTNSDCIGLEHTDAVTRFESFRVIKSHRQIGEFYALNSPILRVLGS